MPHISEADLKQAEKGSNEGISQGSAGAVWFHYFSGEKEGGWGEEGREPRHTSALCAGLHQLNQAHITLLVVRADPGALHLFPQCFSIPLTKTDSSVFRRVL